MSQQLFVVAVFAVECPHRSSMAKLITEGTLLEQNPYYWLHFALDGFFDSKNKNGPKKS